MLLREESLPCGQEVAPLCPTGNWRFFQITSGVAYWLGKAASFELQGGALLAAAPHAAGSVRASQISDAVLRHFCFNPHSVIGLFTPAERAEFARRTLDGAHIFPPDHPAAQVVIRAPLPEAPQSRLVSRANVLHAALLVLAESAPSAGDPPSGGTSSRRFHRLVSEVLDESLLARSSQEIAGICGCSRRHLNSLWHQEFGHSIRSAQRELRLRLARELIQESQGKISNIARRLGFVSVSRFNAAFKDLFGCTPTECRGDVSKS